MSYTSQHIDSLITIGLGVAFLATSARKSGEGDRRRGFLRVASIIMIVVGGILLILPSPSPSASAAPKETVVQSTDDGIATISFPGPPTRTIIPAAKTPDGHDRETYRFAPEGQDLDFRLSRSGMDEAALSLSPQERIEILVAGFQQKGFRISDRSTTDQNGTAIYGFSSASPDGNAISFFRIGFVGDQIYRAIATQGKGAGSHEGFDAFLASFRLQSTPQPRK